MEAGMVWMKWGEGYGVETGTGSPSGSLGSMSMCCSQGEDPMEFQPYVGSLFLPV